ncbi:MAG TPA: hypothetical protein VNO31_01425 [Umezawaea sp.]|nr:hypothetical protein [Umezawaea sp.]
MTVELALALHFEQVEALRLLSVALVQLVELVVRRPVVAIAYCLHSMMADVAALPHVTRGPSFYPTQAHKPRGVLAA